MDLKLPRIGINGLEYLLKSAFLRKNFLLKFINCPTTLLVVNQKRQKGLLDPIKIDRV